MFLGRVLCIHIEAFSHIVHEAADACGLRVQKCRRASQPAWHTVYTTLADMKRPHVYQANGNAGRGSLKVTNVPQCVGFAGTKTHFGNTGEWLQVSRIKLFFFYPESKTIQIWSQEKCIYMTCNQINVSECTIGPYTYEWHPLIWTPLEGMGKKNYRRKKNPCLNINLRWLLGVLYFKENCKMGHVWTGRFIRHTSAA